MGEDGQAFIGSLFNTLNWAQNGEGQKCKPVKGCHSHFSSEATKLWFAARISFTELYIGMGVRMWCAEYVKKTEVPHWNSFRMWSVKRYKN